MDIIICCSGYACSLFNLIFHMCAPSDCYPLGGGGDKIVPLHALPNALVTIVNNIGSMLQTNCFFIHVDYNRS